MVGQSTGVSGGVYRVRKGRGRGAVGQGSVGQCTVGQQGTVQELVGWCTVGQWEIKGGQQGSEGRN